MTREEILNTPEIVDFMIDKSVMVESKMKLHKRLDELCKLAIKALEQEPCDDCISRQAVLDKAVYTETEEGWSGMTVDVKDIEALPPVKPQEPKTGYWIKYGIPRCGEQHYKCTNCDEYFNFGLYSDYYKKAFKYCPNCGAKMVESQESEDRNDT